MVAVFCGVCLLWAMVCGLGLVWILGLSLVMPYNVICLVGWVLIFGGGL